MVNLNKFIYRKKWSDAYERENYQMYFFNEGDFVLHVE